MLARIAEGLRLVRRDRRLIGTLTVTVIYNVFGWPFTSMIPVIGQDHLQLGPEGIGILASMDGIGAFAGAVLMAMFCRPRFYRHAYVGGVMLYMVMLIVFALVPMPAIAGTALLFTGLGGAGFSIMQATLVYLSAPPEMRSRMLRRAVGVHRRRADRLRRARLAGRRDRRTVGDRRDRHRRPADDAADAAVVAGDLTLRF